VTHFVLLGLGALIVVLTIVICFGWLPSLRIVPDKTHFELSSFRRISLPI
jgi:preprotein translocase subunit SecF